MSPGFVTVEHNLHGKRRAALSPLFSSRAIAIAAEITHEQVENLSSAQSKSGSPLPAHEKGFWHKKHPP